MALDTRCIRDRVGPAGEQCRVVALRALQRGVRSAQSEARGRVVERRPQPVRGRMALIAGRRESGLRVVRIGRPVVIRLMALDAGRAGEAIRSARAERRVVALLALQRRVRPSKREARRSVIKRRAGPVRGAVAGLAGLRESGLHVTRVCGAVVIRLVARVASRAGRQVVRS